MVNAWVVRPQNIIKENYGEVHIIKLEAELKNIF